MDYHSLSRKELQSLCKKNKIPANITNLAMADALTALPTVEGLEDLLTDKPSVDTPAKTGIKQIAPRTTVRTSTRRKQVREEPQTTQISTRTRGGARRAPAGNDPENAAPLDLVTRKMDTQLKEAADDEKKGAETPAAVTTVSRRKTGATLVKGAYSTRRSTRMLEKQLMGLNLEDVDDGIVGGDAQVVEELVAKEVEVEEINKENIPNDLQEKTDLSDNKHASLSEDGIMAVNNDEDGLKIELQQKSEVIDESVDDDKNANTEDKGCLESELAKIQSNINDPSDGFVSENKEECFTVVEEPEGDSFDQVEKYQEKPEDDENLSQQDLETDESLALNGVSADLINKVEPELEQKSSDEQLENEESLPLDGFASDSINMDEKEPAESDEMAKVVVVHEAENNPTGLNQLPSEEKMEFEISFEENSDQPTLASKVEENKAFEIVISEQSDQMMVVSEMEDVILSEKSDQLSSLPVISESEEIVDSEAEVGLENENGETNSPKVSEKSNALPEINKENLAQVKGEKVKIAPTEMSMRQLKKMLKQLQITDKNADNKEEEDIAKMGKARLALQPLSDNCLATSVRENGN